jgi:probable rRNA maturation factor
MPDGSWLTITVVLDDGSWPDFERSEALVLSAAHALSRHASFAGEHSAEACVALSSDDAVRQLNASYRQKDKPTNVLSFPAPAMPGLKPDKPRALGDIIVAGETIEREAREQQIAPDAHLQHLVVHGLLHLLGYDHETDEDASAMEGLEIEILGTLGVANPYADAHLDVPARSAATR